MLEKAGESLTKVMILLNLLLNILHFLLSLTKQEHETGNYSANFGTADCFPHPAFDPDMYSNT